MICMHVKSSLTRPMSSFLLQIVNLPDSISSRNCTKNKSNREWQRNSYIEHAPSYIHDTPDFLRKLEATKNQIPSTAIIGTFNVSPLYTDIPHDEGVSACEALTESDHTSPSIDDLKALLYDVLEQLHFHG